MVRFDKYTMELVFQKYRLTEEALQEIDSHLAEDAPKLSGGDAMMDAAELRRAMAEMGDTVGGRELHEMVMQADPGAVGAITWQNFTAVISMREEQLKREHSETLLTNAYVALGGSSDKEQSVFSNTLIAITQDFCGGQQAAKGVVAVERHRMESVLSVLDMGGSLDEEEQEELKDISKISLGDIREYMAAITSA